MDCKKLIGDTVRRGEQDEWESCSREDAEEYRYIDFEVGEWEKAPTAFASTERRCPERYEYRRRKRKAVRYTVVPDPEAPCPWSVAENGEFLCCADTVEIANKIAAALNAAEGGE